MKNKPSEKNDMHHPFFMMVQQITSPLYVYIYFVWIFVYIYEMCIG